VIHYTVTVTQQGSAAAAATLSDDLSDVLDDANYNGDVNASIGAATVTGNTLAWSGTVPVGQVATITYSVTVHDIAGLEAGGNKNLTNPVTSPGCEVVDGKTPHCVTDHPVGYYLYSKVADPATTTAVTTGDKVTYTVTITQQGQAAVQAAMVQDDLSKVLDDASYNNDVKASSGTVSVVGTTLKWDGDLAVGQKVTITYSVTVNGQGDSKLANVVTTTDQRGHCETEGGCQTEHPIGSYTFSKVADPESGSMVDVGDKVVYTVTITQHGHAIPGAVVQDDLSKVLDDATYNNDAQASSGTTSVNGKTLKWTGDLAVGQTVTLTYSMTVTGKGDGKLANAVTSPDKRGSCDKAVGCQTNHNAPPPPAGAAGGVGELPKTGGNLIILVTLAGLLLVGGALLAGFSYLRRRIQ
jgi:fimbrial isopeptide formation D2 family protein/LPXTG-motif cell wall-anchored protein